LVSSGFAMSAERERSARGKSYGVSRVTMLVSWVGRVLRD